MRSLFVILLLGLSAAQAAVVKMETRSTGSRMARMIKEGIYNEYLAQKHLARLQVDPQVGNQHFIDYSDDFYLANITLGTPAQTFTIVPDTGSSNLWVIDADCNTSACNGFAASNYKKKKFNTGQSSTFVKESRTFTIRYKAGSCKGYLGLDNLSLGGLSVKNQEFGVATHVDSTIGYQPMDGIMGLGWPALAVDKVVPPMQNLLPSLDQQIFTVFMAHRGGSANQADGGLITYGGFDNAHCDFNIQYVALSSETYWQFPMDAFQIGDFITAKKTQAISDTGTSWLGCPESVFKSVVAQTKATLDKLNEVYTVPCDQMSSLPPLFFTFNGQRYEVLPKEYVLDLGLGNGRCVISFFSMGAAGFGPSWILGDTWMRSYCQVYDIKQKRIGFASALPSN